MYMYTNMYMYYCYLYDSASHQHPLKLASLRQNAAYEIPLGIVYDSVFVLSSGRVTSIGPGGQFNWQVCICVCVCVCVSV